MKKKIIVGLTLFTSLFTLMICGALGIYLLVGNDYGFNIDKDSLFPSVEVTTLNASEFPRSDLSQYLDIYLDDTSSITFKNETSQPISIDLEKISGDGNINYTSLYGYLSSNLYFEQTSDNTYSIKAVPNNYQYYMISSVIFIPNDDSDVGLQFGYDGGVDYPSETENIKIITLEQGDSYEIKLP